MNTTISSSSSTWICRIPRSYGSHHDGQVEKRDVAPREFGNRVVEFEFEGGSGLEKAGEPEERVAGTRERVNDDGPAGRSIVGDGGDVSANEGCEPVARALDDRAAQQPDAASVPVTRRESVDADVGGVAEAVAPVPLDLPQLEQLIPLRPEEQPAVVAAGRRRIAHLRLRVRQAACSLRTAGLRSSIRASPIYSHLPATHQDQCAVPCPCFVERVVVSIPHGLTTSWNPTNDPAERHKG